MHFGENTQNRKHALRAKVHSSLHTGSDRKIMHTSQCCLWWPSSVVGVLCKELNKSPFSELVSWTEHRLTEPVQAGNGSRRHCLREAPVKPEMTQGRA